MATPGKPTWPGDEPFQLRLLSHQLANLDFDRVDSCTSGAQALALLATQANGEKLIFLDLDMPGMDVHRAIDQGELVNHYQPNPA